MTDDPRVEFCRREHSRLVGALSLYCGDTYLAEEIAQEALARACRSWGRIQDYDSPGAWTHRVALNLASSHFRRRAYERRARERLAARTPAAHHDPDTAVNVAVREAVAALPPRQRAALVLRYFSDLPVAEVAKHMGCAEGTVRALTSQAVAALRGRLAVEVTEEPVDVA
jgi:RNA polymerase sigma-70 factor (ECF subfamily)